MVKGPETPIWLNVLVVEASILGATLPVWVAGMENVAVRESGAEVVRYWEICLVRGRVNSSIRGQLTATVTLEV